MKIDDINLAIIKHLKDGRKPFKLIADDLGVTENTIRSRVGKMVEEGLLNIVGLVDPEKLDSHRVIKVGVKLKTMDLISKGEEFSKLKGVVSVSVITGRYDLMLTVLINDKMDILEFFTNEVAKVDEVQSVETFVVYKGYNVRVPYIL